MAVPHRGRVGGDGLSDREREFVRLRRREPEAPAAKIMKEAGFSGDRKKLTERARVLMKKPAVARAVLAPEKNPAKPPSNEELKGEIRLRLLQILRDPRTTDADKIRAADKLLATVPGGFVPVQIESQGKMTMEWLVRQMGGAPEDLPALNGGAPQPQEDA